MPFTRRAMLLSLAATGAARGARWCAHVPAKTPPAQRPARGRVPFGWPAFPIDGEVTLRFPRPGDRLRIVNAVDSREPRVVDVYTARTRRPIGAFDLRYAYVLQPFELRLTPDQATAAVEEGLILRQTTGQNTTWLLSAGAPDALQPHLLIPGTTNPVGEFHRRLRSLSSLQPFGWLEGCVLEALHDLRATGPLNAHLRHFLPDRHNLIYEDPVSLPSDNQFRSIEETLPIAVIARTQPDHAAIGLAIRYWNDGQDEAGCVVGKGSTTAEGSYTVAYPMAVAARLRRDRSLEDLAIRQLRLRRDRLASPSAIQLRWYPGGKTTYRSWARGVAWYSLGLVRTLEVLNDRDDIADLRDELRRVLTWALTLQRPDGLWNCYLPRPETGAETSGSAGIATAIARAAKLGILPATTRDAARRTAEALQAHLTPDGFLGGVSQSNRAGEALQEGGYRVISQMGMGLMGQLAATSGL